ncbi:DUF2845 domain-containing protein [Pseudomonas benzenivorans]|uniref:DUF2845 domain-containing protein n=2 Tax=Pseudomonas benzenivorans TaxID=556533 RepID=A0ABY5HD45_9PSED|nr:DUF2845 domain-containing protein [Pseudomonas benzenivorans]UTW09274.1 DUF2845 domain-containing protein [Pseudomonas benzenivorans]
MTMKSFTLALLMGCAAWAQADTLRCGSQLVSLGDRSFEVQQKCGEPAFRDLVGYTLGPYDRREFKIEEWVYGPNNGVLSILTFEGNRLIRIERRR